MCASSIITVSGLPGSGTSTVCDLLCQQTGWRYINAGMLFRQMAEEAQVSLGEFGARAETDARIDRDLDARLVEEAASEKGGVLLEGRITGWMAARHELSALKVWVEADIKARAERVGRREGQTVDEALRAIEQRERSEEIRYAAHHGISIADLSPYDLVIDSVEQSPEELAAHIIRAFEASES